MGLTTCIHPPAISTLSSRGYQSYFEDASKDMEDPNFSTEHKRINLQILFRVHHEDGELDARLA